MAQAVLEAALADTGLGDERGGPTSPPPAATGSPPTGPADGGSPLSRLGVIASTGGIIPLVKLVSTGNDMSKEQAASALWHLSVDEGNKMLITRSGGIAPIVQLLDDGSIKSHQCASGMPITNHTIR